jgi:antitoxin component of RelBE/YafQ-DinJ toxin-antitoxin module
MGGAAAGIGALKTGALKMFGKEGAKNIPQVVTTPPIKGKPEWFDSLVNKVIAEGDDVTKKLATKEREIVHIKKIDEDSTVTVTQDLDEGIVRVEYDSPENTFADTVQLQYKKPLPDEVNPNPKAQFDVAESGPVGRSVGPDDYDIDVDEVGGTGIKDLDSDVSKLKEYATGKKPTLKEIVQNKKRKDKAKAITEDPAAQSDAVTARQGDADDSFYSGSDYGDVDDFASGGRVGLLKGGGVLRVILQNLAERYGKKPSELLAVTNYKSLPVEVRKFLTKEQFDVIKKDMQSRRVEQFENLRDMIKSRQEFDRSAEALKKMGMDISDTMLPLMNKAVTPGGTTADDLLMMEQVIKNLRMKDRKLNASGGLAGMLGE